MSAAGPVREVVVSLGSNLGDRLAHLRRGVSLLCADGDLGRVAVSGVYETAPVGGPAQDDYLNAVLLAVTSMPALEVLRRAQAAEAALRRIRAERWGPRTLDVDVIACGDEISADPVLTLPHPRAHERAFVLVPWLEIAPGAILPGYGRVADLVRAVGIAGVSRLAEVTLGPPGTGQAGQGAR
ncbi:MAG: 2-amino-4-hydroxy-6-hydroxymethyldihydropteridine diphosphokinase [Streptosporangiaceae bacterium]